MDTSVLENQMDASIQSGKAQLQAKYDAIAQGTTSKVAGVLHDITMPTGAALVGNIGKGAVAIARNSGLISAPEGGVADTLINKGFTSAGKQVGKQLVSKIKGTDASDASDATSDTASASTSDTASASTSATTTATTAEEGDAFVDAGSDIFSNIGSSATSGLFKTVNISSEGDSLENASQNLASTQSGSSSASSSLQGGDEDGVGARITSTAESSKDADTGLQTSSKGGEAVEDTATTTAEDTGADAVTDTLATATEASTMFDDVPVAGLVVTGALAIGTEIASWFEKSAPKQLTQVGVQASNATGLTTI